MPFLLLIPHVPVNRFDIDRYTKALTKTTTRLEALLKVIVTPVVGGAYQLPTTPAKHRTTF